MAGGTSSIKLFSIQKEKGHAEGRVHEDNSDMGVAQAERGEEEERRDRQRDRGHRADGENPDGKPIAACAVAGKADRRQEPDGECKDRGAAADDAGIENGTEPGLRRGNVALLVALVEGA